MLTNCTKIGLLEVCLVLIAASAIANLRLRSRGLFIAVLGFTARCACAWLTGGGTLKIEKKSKRLLVV